MESNNELIEPVPSTPALQAPVTSSSSAGVINQITINLPPATTPKTRHTGAKPAAKDAKTWSKPLFDPALFTLPDILALPTTIKPEHYTDDKTGEQVTRYTAADGSVATFRESTTNHRAVTLTLTDSNGALVTQGNQRGFTLQGEKAKQSTTTLPIVRDTLNCPAGSADMNANQTESVTRDKLQQFAADHPQLANTLRGVNLPVTVTGELPVTFAKAVDTPTQYRACPENRSGIVIERLTEKSAKR